MTRSSKVTIHMVSSLDGFIARQDGSVSWMQSKDKYEKGKTLSDEEITKFLEGVDCYVMGSRTYEHALELGWPYAEVPVVVLTNKDLKTNKKNVEFFAGDLEKLVNKQLRPRYQNIWMVGGAMLAKDFIQLGLANDIVVSIMPVLLGGGTLFFDHIGKEEDLHLKDVTAYKDGMVELCYEVLKSP